MQAPPDFGGPLVEQLESVGSIDALIARYDGRITHHAPWHLGHETDVMMHGHVDVDDVEKWLATEGYDWLTFVDNGRLTRSKHARRRRANPRLSLDGARTVEGTRHRRRLIVEG